MADSKRKQAGLKDLMAIFTIVFNDSEVPTKPVVESLAKGALTLDDKELSELWAFCCSLKGLELSEKEYKKRKLARFEPAWQTFDRMIQPRLCKALGVNVSRTE